jgi:hypothetical protein
LLESSMNIRIARLLFACAACKLVYEALSY